jgi:hypothetical protein
MTQYIIANKQMPGGNWSQHNSQSIQKADFEEIKTALPCVNNYQIQVGIGIVISCLDSDDGMLKATLERFLDLAEETETPAFIQLDVENWWGATNLWNWWDPSKSGYDPSNRENVEWTGWSSDNAIKIGWRNWGSQFRVLPQPNLMSRAYREAVHKKLQLLVPIIVDWWQSLPESKKDLFIAMKIGHESSIGLNAWHYPNGNELIDKPASEDPQYGLSANDVPSRGVAQIGYASVKTAGIRSDGQITEADLAEVVRIHLEDFSREISRHGIPREKLFTHCGGWKNGELLYRSALNEFSCPGWSFYHHASDPRQDIGVQQAINDMDAPSWAAVEWLFQGPRETKAWYNAIKSTLGDSRCRLVCIYNWEGIRKSDAILEAIRKVF